MASGFIFEDEEAPFAQCHASTIAETPGGLAAAWFAGTEEGADDVGIWLSHHDGRRWAPPVEIADGAQADGREHPCWNPVLYQQPGGPLALFYKVGPSPRAWWGVRRVSHDGGRTWSHPRRLPDPYLGPVRNKPVALPGGDLLCGSSTEDEGWRVYMERTADLGDTWRRIGPLNDERTIAAIQPTILEHGEGVLQVLCRTRQGRIGASGSRDGGRTWSPMELIDLPNPNSGIDAVTLADGRHVLVYNHAAAPEGRWGGLRSPLNVAVSEDGRAWRAALVLEDEPGEYSYPAVIRASDGRLHVTYTWRRRRIRHVAIDPAKLEGRPIVEGVWPE